MSKTNDRELLRKLMMAEKKIRSGLKGEGRLGCPPPGHGRADDAKASSGDICKNAHDRHFDWESFKNNRSDGDAPHRPMPPGQGRPPFPPPAGAGMRRPPMIRERLLELIDRHPEGIRQKEIAQQSGINQSSASELINKLETDGYIVRKVDPADKRATLLSLTELGQARAAEVEDEEEERLKGIFGNLTEEEKIMLNSLLDKLLLKTE